MWDLGSLPGMNMEIPPKLKKKYTPFLHSQVVRKIVHMILG